MIEKFEVDFSQADAEQRTDIWVDTARPIFDLTPIGESQMKQPMEVRGWLLDKVPLFEAKFGAQVSRRTKRRHCNASANALVVQFYIFGDHWGEVGGEPLRIRPGEINVTDYSRPHYARSSPTHVRSLLVAHHLVGYDPAHHPAIMRIGTETVIGHVLQDTLNAIFNSLDRTSPDQAPRIADGLISLLRSVLFKEPAVASASADYARARARAIRTHIDERVSKERLTPEMISSRFNVSRTTLYRDFKKYGGVERFILGRRLEAALVDLAFGPAKRGAVTNTAEQMGFASTAHFSREFRRRFGFSPSDVMGTRQVRAELGLGEQDRTQGGCGDVLQEFLNSL